MKKQLFNKLSALSIFMWAIAGKWAAANPITDDSPPEIPRADTNIAGSLIWVICSLLFVVVLIVLVIKWLAQRNRSWGANQAMRSLGGVPLGQNKSLQVVEVAGRIYVVGVGDTVVLLDKVDDAAEVEQLLGQLEQSHRGVWNGSAWKDAWMRLRRRNDEDGSEVHQWQEPMSFQSLLRQKQQQQSDRNKQVEQLLKEQKQDDRLMDE